MPTMTIQGLEVNLSDDQLAVMDRLAHGDNYTEIACRENVTYWTVKKRVRSVCDALGARNRIEALCLLLSVNAIPGGGEEPLIPAKEYP